MIGTLKESPRYQAVVDEWTQVRKITDALIELARAHPKKAAIAFLFNLWVYSLMFQHLTELRSLWELVPFLH